ncbi:hypothetical protein H4582DRAFT_1901694 [Lactarius indigo]|nr:hypothetical protein H4582DRAFT_1901694 [Lactarius indigo]
MTYQLDLLASLTLPHLAFLSFSSISSSNLSFLILYSCPFRYRRMPLDRPHHTGVEANVALKTPNCDADDLKTVMPSPLTTLLLSVSTSYCQSYFHPWPINCELSPLERCFLARLP